MNIISLLNQFTNIFNENFQTSFTPYDLESKIRNTGDSFTLKLYEKFLNSLDLQFKNSTERKEKFYVKETTSKTLVTSIGTIHFHNTIYYTKDTNKRYVFLRDILDLKPYQRISNEAEYQLMKYAMEDNMSQSGKHALRNNIISRSTVSKKLSQLNGSILRKISRCEHQPEILYIEMDEIHANLQHGGNKICPCAVVHEGHEESFTKRKKLKNAYHFASAKLSYEQLWEVIYDYVNQKYDIDKFKAIFVSGDGASGIKNFSNCFPNAIFVFDKFHYHKALNYLFKREPTITSIADDYLRNHMIDEFKQLVQVQISKFPNQETYMIQKQNYLLNNIDGIINQHHPLYLCPCAMEGHVSHSYARYITSSPFAFSITGLNNKLKLLVYKANHINFTLQDYYHLKYGNDSYQEVIYHIKKLTHIKYDQKLSSNHSLSYNINTDFPKLDSKQDNDKLRQLTNIRNEIYIF